MNNAFGMFFGNFCQGFSVAWWKDKHNLHHAAPNEARILSFMLTRAVRCGCDSDFWACRPQLNHGHVAIDPDIDTLPLLSWSADMLNVRRSCCTAVCTVCMTRSLTCLSSQTLDKSQRMLVRVQHWILFPILLFARLSWCVQSALFPVKHAKAIGAGKATAEATLIALHYTWLLGASFTLLSPMKVRDSWHGRCGISDITF